MEKQSVVLQQSTLKKMKNTTTSSIKIRRVRTLERIKFEEPPAVSEEKTSLSEKSSTSSSSQVSLARMKPKNNKIGGLRVNLSVDDLCKAAVAAQVTQKDVVVVFAEMLDRVAVLHQGETSTQPHPSLGVFQGLKAPKVSLKWYLWRLVYYLNKYPRVEPTFFAGDAGTISADFSSGRGIESNQDSSALSRGLRSLLLALVYIDRVTTLHPNLLLTPLSLHRLMLTAMLVATKFTDDFPLGVDVFAKIGGISAKDMAKMELQFCSLINFDFNVSEPEFEAKCMKNLGLAFDIASQRVGLKRALPSPRKKGTASPASNPASTPVTSPRKSSHLNKAHTFLAPDGQHTFRND